MILSLQASAVYYGGGIIDFNDFFRSLHKAEYEGWIVVEAEQDPLKANPFEYAVQGYKTLLNSLKNAGYQLEN